MSEEQETQTSTENETQETQAGTTTESLVTETKVEETETKTEETKTEEAVAIEPLKVEDISLPEGFELQAEMASEFLEILNGDSSPKDRADALVALHSKTMAEAQEADSKAWENMQKEWRDEVKADAEIGGDKLQPALNGIGNLLKEFGNDEVKQVFEFTGAGNNIHMIKFLNKIANVLTEGKFFTASSPASANDPDAAAKRMFPSMKG